jgi:predicted transcriptional regulator of viral defense system
MKQPTNSLMPLAVSSGAVAGCRHAGMLECLDRGLYRLTDLPSLSDPDLVTVANKLPKGVTCLISALHFHDITTQIPHAVLIAVIRGTERPRLEYPPIQLYWFSGEAFTAGIEVHHIDKIPVQVYSTEKTLADCFKYRNKIGMDTVLEAVALYRNQRNPKPRKLLEYAKVSRVERAVRASACHRHWATQSFFARARRKYRDAFVINAR